LSHCTAEGIVRVLNIFGVAALVALAIYVGWAIVADTEQDHAPMAWRAAGTPAGR
jgi:hypothetical protein